jgi:tRNA G18 (ribose-2'-O)-methylase SpoU
MNVHDYLKDLPVSDIKDNYAKNACSAAVGMTHVSGDFNLGNVIRSANFFGFKEAFYVGGSKSFDRRSTVGTHHYIPVNFCRTEQDFLDAIRDKYSLVCVENNIPKYSWKTISLYDKDAFQELIHPPLFLFGEEQLGIPESLLNEAGYILTVPAFGSVRSMNVGSCAAVIMALYRQSIQDIG